MHQVKKYRWRQKPREDEPVLDDLSAIDHASQRNPLETQDCDSEDDTLDATADISVSDCLTMDHSVSSNKDEPSLHASQMDYGYSAKGIDEPDFHGQEIGDQVEVETESTLIQHLAAEISSNSLISIHVNVVIDVSVHSIQIIKLYNTIPGKQVSSFVCASIQYSRQVFLINDKKLEGTTHARMECPFRSL